MSQNPGLFRRQNDHALEKPPHSTTGVASEVQLQFWKSLHFTPGQHQVRRVHYMYRPKRSIRYSGAHVPVARPIRSRLASLLVITKTRIDKRAHEDRPLGRGFCPHALLGHFVALPHFWCNPAADWRNPLESREPLCDRFAWGFSVCGDFFEASGWSFAVRSFRRHTLPSPSRARRSVHRVLRAAVSPAAGTAAIPGS